MPNAIEYQGEFGLGETLELRELADGRDRETSIASGAIEQRAGDDSSARLDRQTRRVVQRAVIDVLQGKHRQ